MIPRSNTKLKVILSFLNLRVCSFFHVFNGCFNSIKERNKLLNKGMCVLLLNFLSECSLVQLEK